MEYKQKVYIIDGERIVEGLYGEQWDYPMSYVHVGNECIQVEDDCIFENKHDALLAVKNAKVARLEKCKKRTS